MASSCASFQRADGSIAPVIVPEAACVRRLHRAERDGLLQGCHGILERDELVGEIAFELQVRDGLRDGAPVELLRVVELVASGHAAGVEVADVLDVVADGADDVAFHDLHVVNVVEQFDARRTHRLNHFDAPAGVVALVVLVVHLAVEQFQANGDAGVFGHFGDALESHDAGVAAGVVGQALPVPGEGDHVGHLGGGGFGDVVAHFVYQLVVVFLAIPGHGNGAGAGDDGRDETVFAADGPVFFFHQVDAAEAEFGALTAQVVHSDLGVAPARGGLLEASGGRGGPGLGERREGQARTHQEGGASGHFAPIVSPFAVGQAIVLCRLSTSVRSMTDHTGRWSVPPVHFSRSAAPG